MVAALLGNDLNRIRLNQSELTAAVRRRLRDPGARIDGHRVETVDYAFGSPTTDGLYRVRGTAVSGGGQAAWSLFVKLLRSYRHWPHLHLLPAELRKQAVAGPAWRYEVDVYTSGLTGALPAGLRLPEALLVKELDDDRVVLVLEDVATDPGGWDRPRYRSTADLLGRLAVRLTRADKLPAAASRIPGVVTRRFFTSRVEVAVLPVLSDDAFWRAPLMAGADRWLRSDLMELVRRTPVILDGLERLPQVFGHGDASPQNLLVEPGPPFRVVAVDWTLGGLAAAGDDLGQLLIGLAHAGERSTDELPALRIEILDGYTAGLAAEGLVVDRATVARGMDGGLVARSAFTALPLERMAGRPSDELAQLVAQRLQLTRYLVDLGLELPHRPSDVKGE